MTTLLFQALLLAAGAYLAVGGLPFAGGTATLTAADFGSPAALVDVVARPPSLYVRVDEEMWARMSIDERQNWVDNLAARASRSGYTGVTARTTGGRPVAQWLELRGVGLLEAIESSAEAASDGSRSAASAASGNDSVSPISRP